MEVERPSSWLLWLPVPLPLVGGLAACWAGLPHRPLDPETVAFLLLGTWGAAVGVFSGMMMGGQPWRRSLIAMAWATALGPLAVGVATLLVSMPVWGVLRLAGTAPWRIALAIMVCWFLISAAAGVEFLDRAAHITPRRRRRADDDG